MHFELTQAHLGAYMGCMIFGVMGLMLFILVLSKKSRLLQPIALAITFVCSMTIGKPHLTDLYTHITNETNADVFVYLMSATVSFWVSAIIGGFVTKR